MPVSVCWAIVQDANGIKLRLLVASLYESNRRGGTDGLGRTICEFVSRFGRDHTQPGHPLNPADGVSIVLERIGATDTKFSSYRLSLADDRGPIQPILDKISEMEHNSLIPVEETIHILEPEEEWRLLTEVIGDDLVAEVRATSPAIASAHPNLKSGKAHGTQPETDTTDLAPDCCGGVFQSRQISKLGSRCA